MKKAQDFLIDTTLGEQTYDLKTPESNEDSVVLSIDEGAVPASILESIKKKKDFRQEARGILTRLNEYIKSLGNPSYKDKATFFRLLAIMINAGIPIIKSLDTVAEQTVNHRLHMVVTRLARMIEHGSTLSSSMAEYPQIFSEANIGMIKAGEASGQLNQILKQLAEEVEKTASIISKVRGAMIYPAFIILVMIAVVIGMMVYIVPKISDLFSQSGKELPMLTRVVMSISAFMQGYWKLILVAFLAIAICISAFRKTRKGKVATDWLLLHLPIFGKILQKSILARFSRSLGNLLSSGVPIIQSLLINARGLGNAMYRRRVELASEDVSRGIPLAESLRDCPEFPAMMVQMLGVGEQTAQMDTISQKIADYYEEEVNTAVNGISKVIEPVILVFIGVVVGGIVAAVMLPIIDLTDIAGG